MPRRQYDDDDDLEPEEEEDYEAVDEEEGEDEEYQGGGKAGRKRTRSNFIDDLAEEDDEEEEEDDDDEYGGGGGGHGGKRQKNRGLSNFFDEEAQVDSDEDEEEEEGEDDFIDTGADIPDEVDRRIHRRPLLPREDEQEDIEDLQRRIQQRYARSRDVEYDEEATDVEQQALLPSVRDPKLWMVKCAIGREREVAVCLMQKCIDKGPEMQIRSAIALDHLKNYIYIEADKEAHVREAVKGMRNIYPSKVMLVPIKEMTDVLSVESKAIDVSRDTWVRMKIGTYKGDLAKVVDVDNVRQRVTVKLIPRIDLQALANKLEGREVPKKKAFTPPARFMNVDEARELHIRVERRRDPATGDYYENIGGMMFKDGFLYKTVSMKSISTLNVQPTFDELEKFRQPDETGDGDMSSLSTLFANRKKGHFMKGDRVIVVKGDLKNLKGSVEKVEEDTVHIKPHEKGLPKTLAISDRELCKYFDPGNHVKVVSGATEGATGMVVSVEGHVVNIVSDTTKDLLRVFADNVVESSEVTSGITRIGDYELHDLVLMDDNSFGVIIRVESEAFQVLKGVPERPDVALVRLREIKYKIDKKLFAKDRYKNTLSVKDVVKILDGPCRGKQGPVEHIYKGILFIYDRHHLEHAGFICAKSESCMMVGGSRANGDRNGNSLASRFNHLRTPPRAPQSPMRTPRGGPINLGGRHRGGRGHDALVGTAIKIRLGHYKGCKGRVVDVKGSSVRVELESQMKIVTVDRSHVSDKVNVSTPFRETSRYGMGSETPMHPSRTPLHPYMTPMRDPGATPIHDGMRTPMRDRAWNPYTPMSPPRDNWEDANPASWGASPQYQPGSPPSRAYEAPTPGSGWTSTPGGNYNEAGTPRNNTSAYANAPSPYLPSTPGGQPPLTPSSAYLPGTPGGQPMTPGSGGLDMMSPVGGSESEGPWFLPDILVNFHRSGEDNALGVIREVLPDGSCRVALGSSGNGETFTVLPSELEIVVPRKSDKIKIMGGPQRGATGKLIGIDGTDGIVKVDDTLDVKILDMVILAKLAQT
ncbi:putative transcription elongation factor SPT5 homolog 1 [Olea europaea var. sylvestris]|uniref:putative transcription elongation factor SPT5 homolog 1 n=1 Tax=Olea europaea var. sylvestris TaxID=158386 RepID=UPI000C1D8791|nr:putative transcription elongation factor SPT5 homolog 1 [Olea europaea var. sylvestris]